MEGILHFVKKNGLLILGAVLSIATGIHDEKERDKKIDEAVNKALAERQN